MFSWLQDSRARLHAVSGPCQRHRLLKSTALCWFLEELPNDRREWVRQSQWLSSPSLNRGSSTDDMSNTIKALFIIMNLLAIGSVLLQKCTLSRCKRLVVPAALGPEAWRGS